jgi:hypothetical protein
LGLALACTVAAGSAHAEPNANAERKGAARAYDEGVTAFERGNYAVAAARFLEADAIVPSSDALANALSAAERAHDGALLERAATRAIAREAQEPELARTARRLLAESKASTANKPTGTEPSTPMTAEAATSGATTTKPPAENAPASNRDVAPSDEKAHASERERAWPPTVFYAGAAGTAVLLGVTIWSGLDALAARDRLAGTKAGNDSVFARAHRTDALIAGTIVLAAATTYVGLAQVKWGAKSESVALGAGVEAQGAALRVWGNW